ncbi:MAG TPA: anion permease, partial [Vicinamibacterales bacterium]
GNPALSSCPASISRPPNQINASTTHYGTGPAPIVFGAGYLTQGQWWRIGFILSLVHLAIWLPIGFLWWKAIGLW